MADDLTIQAGVKTGGGAAPNLGQALPPSRTADAVSGLQGFAKLASNLLAPVIEREKQAAFVSGMTDVMKGRTAEEVANDQPQWARFFGDNSAVAGARMQEAAAYGTRFVTSINERMPELRKLSQADFSRHVAEAMEVGLPTDPQAAALAKGRIVESLPDLTNQWARQNVQWQQEDSLAKYTEYMGSEVRTFAVSAEARRLNPAAVDEAMDERVTLSFMNALVKPAGVKEEVHQKVVEKMLLGVVGSPGGLGAYLALSKNGGLMEQMSPEFRDRMEIQMQQSLRRDTLPSAYKQAGEQGFGLGWRAWTDKAITSANPAATLQQGAKDLNAEFAKMTGIPESVHQFISPQKLDSAMNAVLSAQERAAAAAQRKADAAERAADRKHDAEQRRLDRQQKKADAIPLQVSAVGNYFQMFGGAPGMAGAAVDNDPDIRQAGKDAATAEFFKQHTLAGKQPGTPEYEQAAAAQALWLTSMVQPDKKLSNTLVTNTLLQPLLATNWSEQARDSLAAISKMPPASRLWMFGADGDKFITLFNKERAGKEYRDPKTGQMVSTEDPQAAWERAKRRAATPNLDVTGGQAGLEMRDRFGSEVYLKGSQASLFGAAAKRAYDDLGHYEGSDRETQAKIAAMRSVFPVGDWAVVNRAEVSPTSMSRGMPMALDRQGIALNRVLAEKGVPANARVMRVQDTDDGDANFYVEWMVDGEVKSAQVFAPEMFAALRPKPANPPAARRKGGSQVAPYVAQ